MALHRTPGDGPLPPDVFVRVRHEPCRPKQTYRVRIREPKDVGIARRRGLGMFLLTGDVPTKFHYPMTFPPVLVLDQRLTNLVDTDLRTIPFRDVEALTDPPLEALATMMLHVDTLAARAMLVRAAKVDSERLRRLVVDHGLAGRATRVRLQEFAPEIPKVGPVLPRADLREQDRKNPG